MSIPTIFLRVARLFGDIREIGQVSEQAAANVSRIANRASKMPSYAGKSIQNTLALAKKDIGLARGAVAEAKKIKKEAYEALADAQLSGDPAAIEAASNLTPLANQLVNRTTRQLREAEAAMQAAKDIHRGGGAAALIGGPFALENQEEPVNAWDMMEALSPASSQEVLTGIVTGQPTPLLDTTNVGLHFLENPFYPLIEANAELALTAYAASQPTVAVDAAAAGKFVQEVTTEAAAETSQPSVWDLAEKGNSVASQNVTPPMP